ncbi:hypothetical protein HDE_02711 [Halotydeus destructor]|nr:hypothetical protein HDE_02711 [Halotydeus destructor]
MKQQQLAIGQQVGQETDERSETEPETEVKWTTPRKRSTMLLNKLMHALQKAIDAESGLPVPGAEMSIEGQNGVTIMGPEAVAAMAITSPKDLQRRAGEGKMFWRCYFNAVSCF